MPYGTTQPPDPKRFVYLVDKIDSMQPINGDMTTKSHLINAAIHIRGEKKPPVALPNILKPRNIYARLGSDQKIFSVLK